MSGPYKVRRLRLGELDRIMEIERASFGRDAYDRKLFAEYARKCGELFLVAEGSGKVCGYMLTCTRALPGGGLGAEVISVAVLPARRGKGVASALMESTLRRLRLRQVMRLSLMVMETNHKARRFYRKHGFETDRRVKAYYENGRDGIRMFRRWE
jgi:[ribosomal protein S18]-alanine N-acetyltransferase